jgi:hypothetical protein
VGSVLFIQSLPISAAKLAVVVARNSSPLMVSVMIEVVVDDELLMKLIVKMGYFRQTELKIYG